MKAKLAILVAAVLVTGPAGAQPPGAPAYRTTFYNNAAHTTQVGMILPSGCEYDPIFGDSVTYHLFGSTSSYHDDELVGYCREGSYEPIN